MRAICVDDEALVLRLTVSLCRELPRLTEVEGFTSARKALEDVQSHPPAVALLDIDMPGMTGMELARRIREISPDTAIIFLTGYQQYAIDAFSVHATGYLLKPVNPEQLAAEVEYALSNRGAKPEPRQKGAPRVTIRTFGEFDVYVDGKPVIFSRAKAREVMAFLIDRNGSSITRKELFTAIWEDSEYDRSEQKYLDVIIRSLRSTLEEHGAGDILHNENGRLRIDKETVDCDLFRLLARDKKTAKEYRGEYMSAYTWASMTEGYLSELCRELLG